MLLQVQPEGWLQYGALGLLALVLFGLGWGMYSFGNKLINSLNRYLESDIEGKKRLTEAVMGMNKNLGEGIIQNAERSLATQLEIKELQGQFKTTNEDIRQVLLQISADSKNEIQKSADVILDVRQQLKANLEALVAMNNTLQIISQQIQN